MKKSQCKLENILNEWKWKYHTSQINEAVLFKKFIAKNFYISKNDF